MRAPPHGSHAVSTSAKIGPQPRRPRADRSGSARREMVRPTESRRRSMPHHAAYAVNGAPGGGSRHRVHRMAQSLL